MFQAGREIEMRAISTQLLQYFGFQASIETESRELLKSQRLPDEGFNSSSIENTKATIQSIEAVIVSVFIHIYMYIWPE